MSDDLFRLYDPVADPFDADGYPLAWQEIKYLVRERAGHRCVRCGHPYRVGEEGSGEWTTCAESCTHQDDAPLRIVDANDGSLLGHYRAYNGGLDIARAGWWEAIDTGVVLLQAQWRVLTVHHLDGSKANCRVWNLAALCQRCHLEVQGRVKMDRPWPWPHSSWMRPYVAGFYALKYLAEDLGREETEARLDELLALGLEEEAVERMPL